VDSGLTPDLQGQQHIPRQIVSILISVDSGLTLDLSFHFITFPFSFNPYFSGFRSYTWQCYWHGRQLLCVSILISVDSGLTQCNSPRLWICIHKFQSLFQWIPVLHSMAGVKYYSFHHVSILISVDSGLTHLNFTLQLFDWFWVSILISVDSGLTHKLIKRDFCELREFQSLFQWIPVLHPKWKQPRKCLIRVSILISVDSGLTQGSKIRRVWCEAVSILISVDSGLTPMDTRSQGVDCMGFQSLFQWIPVLHMQIESLVELMNELFQSLFQWIPVLHCFSCITSKLPMTCFNPYFSGFRSYTLLWDI